MPVYEPLFSDDSFGYRPGRGAKDAIYRIKEYIEQGYTRAVVLDLSRYFDTLNHTILLNLLRKQVKDERVIQMVKRYLKGGVMENGVVTETEEGSPQGGNLSPLLANVYLNEFDWEFHRRGVPCIRYADDIVLLAKSERAAERLLESSTKYLEETLKLKVNREKSRTVSVFAIRNFKFLGFCFGKSGKGIYIRVHGKSWKKAKDKLRQLTSRSRCGSIIRTMEKIKVYMRGWTELLWNSGHEDQHRKPERMAVPPDTDVYLEAVETSEDEKEETHRSGSRQPLCGNHSIRSKRILV